MANERKTGVFVPIRARAMITQNLIFEKQNRLNGHSDGRI